jgi:hypothetical protein
MSGDLYSSLWESGHPGCLLPVLPGLPLTHFPITAEDIKTRKVGELLRVTRWFVVSLRYKSRSLTPGFGLSLFLSC